MLTLNVSDHGFISSTIKIYFKIGIWLFSYKRTALREKSYNKTINIYYLALLPQTEATLADFGNPDLLVYLLPKHFKLFGFPTFRLWAYTCIWWRLFQKHVVRTTFDIYVFINVEISGMVILIFSKWHISISYYDINYKAVGVYLT